MCFLRFWVVKSPPKVLRGSFNSHSLQSSQVNLWKWSYPLQITMNSSKIVAVPVLPVLKHLQLIQLRSKNLISRNLLKTMLDFFSAQYNFILRCIVTKKKVEKVQKWNFKLAFRFGEIWKIINARHGRHLFCVFKALRVGWAIQKGLHHVWG